MWCFFKTLLWQVFQCQMLLSLSLPLSLSLIVKVMQYDTLSSLKTCQKHIGLRSVLYSYRGCLLLGTPPLLLFHALTAALTEP